MAIVIRRYGAEHIPAVRGFNRRLLEGGAPSHLQFPEHPVPRWLPGAAGDRIYNEFFLALDGEEVRGTYGMKHQEFAFGGRDVRSVGLYHHPFSEGIVNKAYNTVAIHMTREALRYQPLLYALGMGGYDQPLPKMLKLLGWSDCLVPFYFRAVHPARFLRHLEMARSNRWRRLLMDIGAFSGAGWIALRAAQGWAARRRPRPEAVRVEEVADFGDWADALWEKHGARYAMSAVRDGGSLRILFPPANQKFVRLRISRGGFVVGWAVVSDAKKNPKYGEMKVGTVLDGFAAPEEAFAVVRAATDALEARGVDLIVSNQSHIAWCRALENAGFLKGPSNFVFAASKKVAELLQPFQENQFMIHFNRADGDGLYQYV